MDREMSLLLNLIDQAFDHKAWHGTNLKGSLRGMMATEAAWRPGAGLISLSLVVYKYFRLGCTASQEGLGVSAASPMRLTLPVDGWKRYA